MAKLLKLTQRSLQLQLKFLINHSKFAIQSPLHEFKGWKQLRNQNPKPI